MANGRIGRNFSAFTPAESNSAFMSLNLLPQASTSRRTSTPFCAAAMSASAIMRPARSGWKM
jgi:hypothetical protein